MSVAASLSVLLVVFLNSANAGAGRDIPEAPVYVKDYTPQFIPGDEAKYFPNYVINNFAGTRDARYQADDDKLLAAEDLAAIGFDYASNSESGFTAISGGQNVSANEAKFTGVYGLTGYNQTGDVYITDYCIIRKVDFQGIVTVYAGSYYDTYRSTYYDDIFIQQLGQSCGWNNEVDASEALFSFPYGLATDLKGNLYIADTENKVIRRVDASSKYTDTFAGYGNGGNAVSDWAVDGDATEAYLGKHLAPLP
jgi:hypothetical protein